MATEQMDYTIVDLSTGRRFTPPRQFSPVDRLRKNVASRYYNAMSPADKERYTVIPYAQYELLWKDATKTVTNLMTGKEVEIDVNTPRCCDPSSELYWCI